MSTIAVFGSSEPAEGSALYEQARRMGALLAGAGHVVLTGGYGGVMEGASRGAREAGGACEGVLCDLFAALRAANPYLTRSITTPDLHARTRALVDGADGYVALHGKSGTLAEVTLVWALHRAGQIPARPMVLLGETWRPLLHHLLRWEMLEPAQLAITRVVDAPEEALEALETFAGEGP